MLPIISGDASPRERPLTCNLDNVDELWVGPHLRGGGDAMPNQAIDHASRDVDRRRLKRARALLEMFAEDCGRQAATVEELRDWMGAQYTDQLQIRMNRRLHGIDTGIERQRRVG
jgi:hypothetical protein